MPRVQPGERSGVASKLRDDAPGEPRATPWILSSWQDLLLFVGTPVLIVPLLALAQRRFSIEEISFFVASFGATGHHLPGMMRAYGDRELFQRFRVRFIAAPILLVSVCLLFAHLDLQGVQLILVLWGLWHGVAQIYGFERIYDTKVGVGTPSAARLDMAVGVAWFGLAVLHAPERMANLVSTFYRAGGPVLSPELVHGFTALWTAGTGAVTLAFAANFIWRWMEGRPPSFVKLALMVSSFGFWWYAMVGIRNVVLGVALFEIFHDVQYLAIVWVFNRKRVEQAPGVGAFTRFVFRRKAPLVGLYLGLVFAYGMVAFLQDAVARESVQKSLVGMLAASALLHFYYDGFIWKVRERSTRSGLGLAGGGGDEARGPGPLSPGGLHAARWSLFAIPVALLGASQLSGTPPGFEEYVNLVRVAPGAASTHYNLGVAYEARGQVDLAIVAYEHALAVDPGDGPARNNLGMALLARGEKLRARREFERALEAHPDLIKAQNNLAWMLAAGGPELRDPAAALRWAESAARASGRQDPAVLDTLAVAYAASGRFDEAVATAEAAVALARRVERGSLADEISQRLALFRRGEPYRDDAL